MTTLVVACGSDTSSNDQQGTPAAAGGAGASSGGASTNSGGSIAPTGGSSVGGTGAATGGALSDGGAGGGAGASGATASGGAFGAGGGGSGGQGAGGAAALGGAGGASGSGCASPNGFDYTFACWPMPNPATTGLPNAATYTDLGDGTVRDEVTGLVWQKSVTSSQAFAWDAANNYCSTLSLAGRTWRLPTRIELLSIVDFTRTGPAIDTSVFPSVPGGKYHWTSSPWVVSQIATKPQYSWIVNFYEGLTSNAGDRTQAEYARCVSSDRAAATAPVYSDVASGEVRDQQTGLVWAVATSPAAMTEPDAEAYCAALGLNGHTFRLPSVKELSTLVDENPPITSVSPAIDKTRFADTPANGWYISSSKWAGPAANSSSGYWGINYQDGYTDPGYKNHFTAGLVRCVR